MKEILSISKKRVVFSVIKRLIEYLSWVFYSAFFVRFILEAIEMEKPLNDILISILLIGGVSLILELFIYYCDNVLFPCLDIKIYHKLYNRVYKKAENVEIACYENRDFYDRFVAALDDMGNKTCRYIDNLSIVISGTIGGILACYTMVRIDIFTIVFLVAPLIGNFLFAPKMNKIYYMRYSDGIPYERKTDYVNRVMYLKEYAKEFRLSGIYNVVRKQYEQATEGKAGIWKKYFNRAFAMGMMQYFFSYIVIFEGILLYGAYQAVVPAKPGITFSEMAVLTSVMVTASWVWVQVINAVNQAARNRLFINKLREFLQYEEQIPEDGDGLMPEEEIDLIEFSHVSFAYESSRDVIHDLSFSVKKGQSLVLAGHNGAGKSTVIKLLLRLYDPTEGVIRVNGRDIREYQVAAYRSLFACAFQDGVLIPGFDMPVSNESEADGSRLSGGECQKLLVARACAAKSSIMIFDEPSSALDPIAENELFADILKHSDGKTRILISHRLSCVKYADAVLMLEQGRKVEEGTHGELMRAQGKYAAMYHIQEKNYFAHGKEDVCVQKGGIDA